MLVRLVVSTRSCAGVCFISDDATMSCEACGKRHDQGTWLASAGEWRESVPNIAHKSFHLSCLVSPFIRWTTLIEEFRAANEALESGDVSLMQVFVNSRLGDCFGGRSENRLDPNTLYARREYFGEAEVPEGVIGLTLGVDTQDDRFIWLLSGWGRSNEVWQLYTGEIMGDMASEDPWDELAQLLERLWYDKDGNAYRSLVSCLDVQGQHYQRAVAFVKARAWKRLRGVRGLGIDKRKSASGALSVIRNVYRDKTLGVPIQNLDVDCAKTMISVFLSRAEKGPVYMHLPCGPAGQEVRGFTLDVCSEFTAEYRKKTVINGYPVYSWHKYYGRANHRLDCFSYSLAGALLSKVKFDTAEPQRTRADQTGSSSSPAGALAQGPEQPVRYGVINPRTGQPLQTREQDQPWACKRVRCYRLILSRPTGSSTSFFGVASVNSHFGYER
jgi:phage terminase large subunit GpA-like protein